MYKMNDDMKNLKKLASELESQQIVFPNLNDVYSSWQTLYNKVPLDKKSMDDSEADKEDSSSQRVSNR